jgi:hypothetical protein
LKRVGEDHPHSFESYFFPHKVFSGNYWDEFSLPSLLLGSKQRILMLGLGKGAAIRPFLASGAECEIITVDHDEDTIHTAKEIFSSFFPGILFETIHADAFEYLKSGHGKKFDIVWVDLYSKEGHVDLISNPEFYALLESALKMNGIVAINSLGLPPQLNPIAADTITHLTLYHLSGLFKTVGFLPYRRNYTVMATQEDHFPGVTNKGGDFHPDLNEWDRLVLRIQTLRVGRMKFFPVIQPRPLAEIPRSFQGITSQMRGRWPAFIQKFNHFGEKKIRCWKGLGEARDLIPFMQNIHIARETLHALLLERNEMAVIFPLFLSSQKMDSHLPTDWFVQYFLQCWSFIYEADPDNFIHYFLPHVAALMIFEAEKYQRDLPLLSKIVEKLQ